VENVQRLVLYVGALLAGASALRTPAASRAVEPGLAAGAVLVIGYGLAGRLLPGIVELHRSQSAGGRLEQPITYWNAEGALAAMGLILCARLAGDARRPVWMRGIAAGGAAPLAAGVYLSYSRGAIAVAVLGLAILVAAAPTRAQLRAAGLVLAVGVAASMCAAAFPGVASLEGGSRARDGAVALAILVLLAAVSALLSVRSARRHGPGGALPWAHRVGPVVAVGVAAVVAGLVVGGLAEKPSAEEASRADATRLASVSSNRYEYWRVGLDAFEREPLMGVGSGGFRVEWLRERSFPEAVRDTHSIEVEMAAELGIVGLLAFGLMVAGVVAAARRALRRDPATAAGWCAALLAWFLHASIDWDWQLPAVTLPAIALAGALVALSEAAER
jgi:O-antigen ligase